LIEIDSNPASQRVHSTEAKGVVEVDSRPERLDSDSGQDAEALTGLRVPAAEGNSKSRTKKERSHDPILWDFVITHGSGDKGRGEASRKALAKNLGARPITEPKPEPRSAAEDESIPPPLDLVLGAQDSAARFGEGNEGPASKVHLEFRTEGLDVEEIRNIGARRGGQSLANSDLIFPGVKGLKRKKRTEVQARSNSDEAGVF
jgi:hypothetical protein